MLYIFIYHFRKLIFAKLGYFGYKAVRYATASYKRIAKEFRRLSCVYAEKFKFSREISTFDRVKIAIFFLPTTVTITYSRTCNGYFYRRTFSRTLLLHQEHNASIWLAKWRWLGEYRPIIMQYFMLVSHGTNVWYQWLVTLPTIRRRMIHHTSDAFISITPNFAWL